METPSLSEPGDCCGKNPAGQGTHTLSFRPPFVVGCERSGTTLLAVMIGRHSEIAMTPETHFFLRVVPKRGAERIGNHAEMVKRLFASPRGGDLGMNQDEVLARFSEGPATYAELFRVVMALYAAKEGKARAGEKTPFHLWHVPLILRWFPEAKIVGIVRDGRDVVRSILNAPWTAHASLRRQSHKWATAARVTANLQQRYPDRFLLVRYEDLVLEAEKTVRQVDEFLGLAFEPAQLESTQPTHVVPGRERGWKANATAAPDRSRVGAWEKSATIHERLVMNTMMGHYLEWFGYAHTEVPAVSALTRIGNAIANGACRLGLYRVWFNVVTRNSPAFRRQRKTGAFREAPQKVAAKGAAADLSSG